MRYTNKYLESN